MKKFFISIKNWFARHIPTKRRIIQLYVALLYNANLKGFAEGKISTASSKYMCVPGLNCYSCPGAVGACPLGALQNAFTKSGTSTPYYILGIIGLFGLIFARTVCGFLCPVGLCQELVHKIPSPKIKKSRVTRAVSYLKYVLLVVLVLAVPLLYSLQGAIVPAFCKFICPAGTFEGGIMLLSNSANWTGSRDLLAMLGPIFTWKFALFVAIVVLCVFMYRPFCRFICPLGAIYGFFNKFAFLGVKVDKIKCTDCGLCVKHCKMDIKHVGDHECIHCGMCIKVCPVKAISWKGAGLFDGKAENADVEKQKAEQEEKQATRYIAPDPAVLAVAGPATPGGASAQKNAPPVMTPPEQETSTVQTVSEISPTNKNEPHEEEFRSGAPPPKKRRRRSFWLQVAACCMAFIALLSEMLYFNVFAKSEEAADVRIGADCPDFSLRMYGKNDSGRYRLLDDKFTLSEELGSVIVVNFWATWCGPCVAEIPHFNRIAEEFPEVKVVAVQGDSGTESVPKFITDKGWTEYKLLFLQDDIADYTCQTYQALGGNGTWPMTLIVGKDGKITFTRNGSITYDQLKAEVQKALDA